MYEWTSVSQKSWGGDNSDLFSWNVKAGSAPVGNSSRRGRTSSWQASGSACCWRSGAGRLSILLRRVDWVRQWICLMKNPLRLARLSGAAGDNYLRLNRTWPPSFHHFWLFFCLFIIFQQQNPLERLCLWWLITGSTLHAERLHHHSTVGTIVCRVPIPFGRLAACAKNKPGKFLWCCVYVRQKKRGKAGKGLENEMEKPTLGRLGERLFNLLRAYRAGHAAVGRSGATSVPRWSRR